MTIDCDKTLGSQLQYSSRELEEDRLFASSKVLLTAQFSEIRTESGSFIHRVQLVLTTDCEIIVLKQPTDKCNRRSFLRRHKLSQTEFTMHSFTTNSFTAIIPDTILRYSYQICGNTKCTIGEWLLKISHCKLGKKSKKSTNKEPCPAVPVPERDSTSTAGQSTSYQHTEESLNTHDYSSPSHPVQRPLPLPSQGSPLIETYTHPQNEHSRIVQMPSGLIKARSFQDRGSAKHRFSRKNSSSCDLDKRSSAVDEETTPLPPSTSRTPSPFAEDSNPFEGRLRHVQVRNKKRIYSPRGGINRSSSSQSSTNPILEDVRERSYYSRSANSTPLPGLSTSLVIASPSAEASEMGGPSFTRGSSGTLPRTKKGKKDRLASESSHGSPSKIPSKSPKLLRLFHRRWQSSSSIKVPLNLDSDDHSPSGPSGEPRKLHQFPPKEVAEELSLMDAQLLRKIGPEELQNGAWMKKDSKDKLAPNVMAMVRSFNQLALLIPSEILEEKTPQGRAKVITTYIQIASKLYTSHNYNSLKAVLAGLQSTPIYRLNKTWKEVTSNKRKRFDRLCALMSECENWQLYRRDLDDQLSSGSPVIPFLGQFLTQVVQTDSYNQAREDKQASTPLSSLKTSFNPQNLRSSSLDTTSSPITTPSNNLTISLKVDLSVSAPTSPIHTSYKSVLTKKDSSDSDNHSKSLSSDSSCLSPPPSVGLSDDDDEVDGHDDNGSHTTDSGHHSAIEFRPSPSLRKSSTHTTLCMDTPKDSDVRKSQLELSQIYVSLEQHSKSYETLLNTYTEEDPALKDVLDRTLNELTKLSTSLQSLDSVFSDDQEEEEGDMDSPTSSLNVNSMTCYDSDHTSDYGSDAVHVESPISKTDKKRNKAMRTLFRAKSENPENVCPLSPEYDQCMLGQENVSQDDTTQKSWRLQRSKSCSNGGKRRRLKKKSRKSAELLDNNSQEPKTSTEMLNTFQVASLGYSMGVKESGVLRSAICDVEPNSESVSYKLSVEREAT
ncbi:uncharacterized protein LOC135346767 isoform X2 [Halichondria panicea]|uniref:uncharacterized protein LOC135346767 isoform X2 n=1 Tax=Halichondria panicea TaxID=6063 RepID=UPI00312B61A9